MPSQDLLERSIRLRMPQAGGGAPNIDIQPPPMAEHAPASPPPAQEPDAHVRRPLWRRALRVFKRPAAFVRGYLQAPMQQRSDQLAQQIARLETEHAWERDRAEARTQALEEALRHLAGVLARQSEALAGVAARQSEALAGVAARQSEAVEQLRTNLEQHLGRLTAELPAIPEMLRERARLEDSWRRDRAAQAETLQAIMLAVRDRTDLVAGSLGPRLDELDIKIRPIVEYGDDSIAVRLGDGYLIAPSNDPVVVTMLADATSGGFEPGVRQVLKSILQPGMSAADIGANLGMLTLACARAVGPTGKVYAFEPEPAPRRRLEMTLRQNGLSWVELQPVALGAEAGEATFHTSTLLGHGSLYELPPEEAAESLRVPVRTLDDVVGDRPLHLAKIDVEGAELDVLKGMRRTLQANAGLAIVAEFGPSHLERVGLDPDAWFGAFEAEGLRPYAIEEPTGRCARVTRPVRKQLLSITSTNLVFVRPGSDAEKRLLR